MYSFEWWTRWYEAIPQNVNDYKKKTNLEIMDMAYLCLCWLLVQRIISTLIIQLFPSIEAKQKQNNCYWFRDDSSLVQQRTYKLASMTFISIHIPIVRARLYYSSTARSFYSKWNVFYVALEKYNTSWRVSTKSKSWWQFALTNNSY